MHGVNDERVYRTSGLPIIKKCRWQGNSRECGRALGHALSCMLNLRGRQPLSLSFRGDCRSALRARSSWQTDVGFKGVAQRLRSVQSITVGGLPIDGNLACYWRDGPALGDGLVFARCWRSEREDALLFQPRQHVPYDLIEGKHCVNCPDINGRFGHPVYDAARLILGDIVGA